MEAQEEEKREEQGARGEEDTRNQTPNHRQRWSKKESKTYRLKGGKNPRSKM